ncbi:MAG: hypothetical protein QY326_07590 [Bdellovibrionota bacterium]|nr:MAG: hypothetical protein QY326_07590 [Bdellovibrionota bacterium]
MKKVPPIVPLLMYSVFLTIPSMSPAAIHVRVPDPLECYADYMENLDLVDDQLRHDQRVCEDFLQEALSEIDGLQGICPDNRWTCLENYCDREGWESEACLEFREVMNFYNSCHDEALIDHMTGTDLAWDAFLDCLSHTPMPDIAHKFAVPM